MTSPRLLPLALLALGGLAAACGDVEPRVVVSSDVGGTDLVPAPLAADRRRGSMTVRVDDVVIRRGRDAKTVVHVYRDRLPGTVRVSFRDVPNGVDVIDDGVGLAGEHGYFTFRADASAPLVEDFIVTATATGPDGETASARFEMSVRP